MPPIRITIAAALLFAATGACAEVRIVPQHSGVDVRLRGISVVDGNVAWASGREGTVLRTFDGGRHWQAIGVPHADGLDFRDIEGFDAQTAVVLAIGPGEASRVYRTQDGGRSWRLVLQNQDPRAFFDCMAFDGRRGWMLGDPVDGQFQIHATDDGGRDWKLLPDGPPAVEGEAAFAASGTCIARARKTLVAATGGAQSRIHFRSDHKGGWKHVASEFEAGAESKGVFSLVPLSHSGAFIAVGGDFRAEDEPASAVIFAPVGAGFAAKNLPATPGYRLWIACNDDVTTCIAVGPAGVDAWDGVAWKRVSGVGYDAVAISGNIGWASGDDGRIARIEIEDQDADGVAVPGAAVGNETATKVLSSHRSSGNGGYSNFNVANQAEESSRYGENNRAHMPAVVLEVGFHTNSGDAAALKDPVFREAAMKGVEKGFRLKAEGKTCEPFKIASIPNVAGPHDADIPAKINYVGHPQFPVEQKTESVSCPGNWICSPYNRTHAESESPLKFNFHCTVSSTMPTTTFKWKTTLTDADGVVTNVMEHSSTCTGVGLSTRMPSSNSGKPTVYITE